MPTNGYRFISTAYVKVQSLAAVNSFQTFYKTRSSCPTRVNLRSFVEATEQIASETETHTRVD